MWLPSSSRSMKAAIVGTVHCLCLNCWLPIFLLLICQLLNCSLRMFELVTACVSVHRPVLWCRILLSQVVVMVGGFFLNITNKLCFFKQWPTTNIRAVGLSEHSSMYEEQNIVMSLQRIITIWSFANCKTRSTISVPVVLLAFFCFSVPLQMSQLSAKRVPFGANPSQTNCQQGPLRSENVSSREFRYWSCSHTDAPVFIITKNDWTGSNTNTKHLVPFHFLE